MRSSTVRLAVVLLALVSMLAVGCVQKKPEATPGAAPQPPAAPAAKPEVPKTIKIGNAGALTGGPAQLGTWVKKGVQLAIEEANKAGGINGVMIELVAMDDRADPKEAAAIANMFVSDPTVVAVVGHLNSSCTLASAPIYNKGGLVQITATSSSPKVTEAGPYTFRVCNTDEHNVRFNVQLLIDEGYKKIGILYENNDYGRGGYDVAVKTLEKAGIRPVSAESFMLDETKDFGTIIAKFRKAGATAIYGHLDQSDLALFMKQCHAVGYKPQLVGAGVYNPDVIRLGGKAMEGAIGNAMFHPDNIRPSLKAFFDKYANRYKGDGSSVEPNVIAPAGYDAAMMIIEALKKSGVSREGVKNYLTNLKDFDGALGKLSFDENGDTVVPTIYVQVKDGKFVEYTPKKK
ncbi:MAG: ABC transporter substrate-binding protein [Firmicutes bacterium]|nr:ABC transporter substrate-binding protein [Bacillota bacterium]